MSQGTRLRLWPGAVTVLLIASFVIPIFVSEAFVPGLLGGLVGALAVLVWWMFFSRVPWSERVGAVVLMVAAVIVTRLFLDVSIATAGQGMFFYV